MGVMDRIFPGEGSIRLRVLQSAQMSIAVLTLAASVLTLIIPSKTKRFTFGLLYTLILTSVTTSILVRKERVRAANGTLTKDKYIKYQIFKFVAAIGMSVIGSIAFIASVPSGHDIQMHGEQGWWINGYKVNVWQGMIVFMSLFNWLFLWASLFYSCCMTGQKQGDIRLGGEEANIGLNDETVNDEAIAREIQSQDGNWES